MPEYRTRILDTSEMMTELQHVVAELERAGNETVLVAFGWGCNLPIDRMWQSQSVQPTDLLSLLARSVSNGEFEVGAGDFIVTAGNLEFTLCHESDCHVSGESSMVYSLHARWSQLGFDPYEVARKA